MRPYMTNYRKQERELLNLAKQTWGWNRKGFQIKASGTIKLIQEDLTHARSLGRSIGGEQAECLRDYWRERQRVARAKKLEAQNK